MGLIEPRWKLFDIHGRPMTWDTLNAHNVFWHLWHDRRERMRAPRGRQPQRPSRSITITEAGRAYLAALRESRA